MEYWKVVRTVLEQHPELHKPYGAINFIYLFGNDERKAELERLFEQIETLHHKAVVELGELRGRDGF